MRAMLCLQVGDTALIWASFKGHEGIVMMLLERDANVNIPGQVRIPLTCRALISKVEPILIYRNLCFCSLCHTLFAVR
jgi:ankyrin repeat protein